MFSIPPIPGHGATDELLGYIAPSASVKTEVFNITDTVAASVVAVQYRKTILLQPLQDIWFSAGDIPAAAGTALKIPAGAIFGLDLYHNVPVTMRAVSGGATVVVMQLSQHPNP